MCGRGWGVGVSCCHPRMAGGLRGFSPGAPREQLRNPDTSSGVLCHLLPPELEASQKTKTALCPPPQCLQGPPSHDLSTPGSCVLLGGCPNQAALHHMHTRLRSVVTGQLDGLRGSKGSLWPPGIISTVLGHPDMSLGLGPATPCLITPTSFCPSHTNNLTSWLFLQD